ncbi:TonB-linked outer membrane protein, SusC/RagA family [Hymenobacter daecheongensis DSM 21074]|uniref:TonB-linked outer membrane protein, SusC/RagA family n=1 Tax=Hymenobacter daecheongensis DSM 21074 TaxID=1121955 RepID=A0A1M6CDJ7_9BACT|nr:SusC/RagA family TonB-linked outer membrane protein [Hymenobacter daecheongensis]SHI58834.1 TonB-linked outer membrane protein, SusC/RagA family [Hymenobacter daecheongensis DSM 21074]
MKKLILLSLFLSLIFVGRSWAQNKAVSGKVLDASTNEGLPGVSVLVKGTTIGTATNSDGNYTLLVPDNATTLEFKQLGYTSSTMPIGASKTIDVTLTVDSKQLSEVVVTALGISREKRALGYAVTEIKSEQVVQKSEPDVLRTLQGKIPGVNIISSSGVPGSSARITIRGNTSLLGNNQPLFVVDGVPYDNRQTNSDNQLSGGAAYSSRTADIDPNNIASINVLKGGAAAALYGSRAANGVIVITTKTGSGTRGPKGVQIGYSTSYSIEKIAGLPDYQNTYGSGSQFNYGLTNGTWGPRFDGRTLDHPYSFGVNNPNGINKPDILLGFPEYANATTTYQPYPNNVKDFFNTGRVFENSVSLTGTGDNASFTAVLSRADNQGMIPNSFFVRSNISAGGSGHFNKFTVGGNVAYTNSQQQGPQLGANNAIGNSSAFSRVLFMPRNMDLQGLPNTNPLNNASVFGWLTGQADNPIWSTINNTYTSRVDRMVSSIRMGYAFKDWLTLNYSGGVNTYTDARRTTVRPGSVGAGGLGNIVEDNIRNTELEQTLLLALDKNLTEDISLKATLGTNVNQRTFEATSFVGNKIIVFGIDNLSNTVEKNSNGADFAKRRLLGVLTDVTVGYKDWAFLTFGGRNDFSSTLNKKGEIGQSGRSFFYPSGSVSVIFTEALGLDYSWLTMGKVRTAVARTGNDASPYDAGPTRYSVNPEYGNNAGTSSFPFLSTPGLALSNTISNPGLTPEFTTEVEAGLELAFLKNRVQLNTTYYDRRTTNQIAAISRPASSGYLAEVTNFGEVSNKGIEVAATLIPVETKNFRWTSTTNFTHNKNTIEELTPGVDAILISTSFVGGPRALQVAGRPYGEITGSVAARDDAGNILINPANGFIIRAVEQQVIANPNPQFTMGIINSFSFKGLTLNTVIDYRKGGDLYSTTLQQYLGRGVTKDTEDRDKTVIIKGVFGNPDTRQPLPEGQGGGPNNRAITLNDLYFGNAAINSADEFSIYDATTVRLREVSLGYDLPQTLLQKTPIGGVNISLSGRNLYWYSPNLPKYTNFDPETSTFGAANAQGFEYTNAPSSRRYGVNLRVTF